MKLIYILIAISLNVSASTYAQQINLSFKNAKLVDVLQSISDQSGYGFTVPPAESLKTAKPVTITLKRATIEKTLQTLFNNQPFIYKVQGNIIMIAPKPGETPKPVEKKTSLIDEVVNSLTTITGTVRDKNGEPLPGATVLIKGTALGSSTDKLGRFSISNAPEEGTLIVRMIGRETREVSYRNAVIPEITLREVEADLSEVQVIAYGQVPKKYSTSNQGTITGEQISRQPVSNVMLAISGRVPGLFIQQSTGQTVGRIGVVVQGINSINSSSEPFFVVDGVPFSPSFTESSLAGSNLGSIPLNTTNGKVLLNNGGNTFNFINPDDIESITILKDADATAIYGSRAANGAILITTKKGKAGKTNVNLNMQSGWGKITKRPEFLNTSQYLEMRREAYVNSGQPIPTSATPPNSSNFDLTIWDPNKNHDWWEEIVGGTASYTTINANVSGGTDRTTFLAGGGYNRQTTVFPNALADKKYNVNLAINTSSENKKFDFMIKGTFLQDQNRLNGTDLTSEIFKLAPNAPDLYKPDGSLNWGPYPNDPSQYSFDNPLARIFNEYHSTTNNFIGNTLISYELIPGLTVKSTFGYNMIFGDEMVLRRTESFNPRDIGNFANSSFQDRSINSYIVEPQLNYTKDFKFGAVNFLLGSSFQETKTKFSGINASGFNNNSQLANMQAATTLTPSTARDLLYRYSAAFARLNYRYNDRYIINLTARRDGSSRFGGNNKFSNFYSVGGAWLFAEEEFIKHILPILSTGKIRLNYGTTGSDQIGDYQYASLLNNASVENPFQGIVGLTPSGHANPNLEWEQTNKLNFGLDLGVFDNKVTLSADFYRNRSSNQLVSYITPLMTGFSFVNKNFEATVQNTGLEMLLNATPIRNNNFRWNLSVNATINRNKLLSFPNLATSSYATQLIVGQPVNVIQAYKFGGVNPTTGLYQFINAKGEYVSSPNFLTDRTQIINLYPKWYGGISNTFSYKGFDLDFLVTYIDQISPSIRYDRNTAGLANINLPTYVLSRWQKEGDITEVQKFLNGTFSSNVGTSDVRYVDGSFFRLKNASLAYTIPATALKKMGVGSARVYIQGQNLLTFTKYEGADPETHSLTSLPPLRMYTLGIQVSL